MVRWDINIDDCIICIFELYIVVRELFAMCHLTRIATPCSAFEVLGKSAK